MSTESICLVDFCGYASPGHLPISYWADWHPASKLMTFGGEWGEIDPVLSDTKPTDAEIEALADFAWWRLSG